METEMGKNLAIAGKQADMPGEGVLQPTGLDLKYWALVQRVLEQFRLGATTTKQALAMAKVDQCTYYRALKSPYIQTNWANAALSGQQRQMALLRGAVPAGRWSAWLRHRHAQARFEVLRQLAGS
jgi:hypothetical protein